MTETTMPAIEAEVVAGDDRHSYELAFHVLPTVAEGEVAGVFESIKNTITKAGAEIFDAEVPERFDLAYEIVKHYEGKNRKFSSAYFGWVRFKAESEAVLKVTEAVEDNTSILRHLLIKLTKVEEAHPFRFHEAIKSHKMVTDVPEVAEAIKDPVVAEAEAGEVNEAEIDEALDKSEV